jgi:hypothetical protein
VPVWFIGHQLKHHGRDTRSRLRRCLTRINAEVAALQVVARMVSDPTFRAVIEQPQAQYFRHYVKSSIGGILADQRYGLSQMTLTDLVLWAMETAAPGEFTNLRSLFGTLDQSARHVSERFLNRVDANSGADPLVLEYDFFLAHSSKDKDISESLSALLRAKSAKVYLDSESLEPGDIWPDALQAAQKRSRITLALVSAHSVKSHWFKSECVTAIELANSGRKHLLVPIMLDASEMPYGTNIVQGIALYAGVTHDEAVDKLVKKLADMGA